MSRWYVRVEKLIIELAFAILLIVDHVTFTVTVCEREEVNSSEKVILASSVDGRPPGVTGKFSVMCDMKGAHEGCTVADNNLCFMFNGKG